MSTFMAKPADIQRKWYVIDAAGKPLGRVATVAASILRGKHTPEYTPHVDCGDHVIVINAAKVILTGNKLDEKMYRRHSGYIGGLKEVPYRRLMESDPEFVMTKAVKGMLPDNTIGRNSIKRLRVYAGDQHEHAAQKPEAYEL
ncbi:MAG: 50S ribosomal protein L13 [Clostridia bacterium]|jgi:large subunit ribosomal protein L13|nr:50S ribosomal protein L13 [Clostridia bacterium]MBQ6553229.1 50S ribosomal protein L13 [Clostridia bacterium]